MCRPRLTAPVVVAAVVLSVSLFGCSAPDRVPAWPESALPTVGPPGTPLDKAGPYPVVAVLDATTLRVDRGLAGGPSVVRMIGIVAPDTTRERPRCFGAQAMAEAHALLDGQAVSLVGEPGGLRVDAEGRLHAYIWMPSGRMANDVLAEGGFAREATGAPAYVYREVFARSEQLARQAERGLWSTASCGGDITRPA